MTLREIIAAAAARFDRRPLYRASIEAKAKLTRASTARGQAALSMGIYYGAFNFTRREWFTGHDLGGGGKEDECAFGRPAAALWILMTNYHGDAIRGRWARDDIRVLHDAGQLWHEVIAARDGETAWRCANEQGPTAPQEYAKWIPGWENIGDELRAYIVKRETAGLPEIAVDWQPDGEHWLKAEVPDPHDPQHSIYRLSVVVASEGAVWGIWGTRRGIHVTNNARDRQTAIERAERVLRLIIHED